MRSIGRSPTEPGAKESNVRLGQAGGGEDVDHLAFGGDGLAHELADGGVKGSANAEVRIPKFSQFDIPNSSFDIPRSVTTCTQRFLPSSCSRMCSCPAGMGRSANAEVRIAKFSQFDIRNSSFDICPVAGDAVFLQHHGDGLGGVEGRVPLAAALGVGDERLLELIGEAGEVRMQKSEFRISDHSSFRIRHSSFAPVARDAVFLQHHGNGLGGVERRVPLTTALGVGDECLLELIGEAGEVRMQKSELRSLVSSTFEIRHSTFARSQAMPCFSSITAMALGKSE
jgi:hypothetical protein